METEIRLTKLASCAGCGAKVGAGTLVQLLDGFRTHTDPRLIVGYDKSDDASVYQVSEELAIVQTTDFFPPIVDDPFLYGQIAAANALSDVYAMGAEPKLALNIMCLSDRMDAQTVKELLREAYFVPETVQADVLFRDMQQKKMHMAIVVDEYGGMSGIVTMEDLLEEIVGNIYDETDPQDDADIVKLSENLWRVNGGVSLEELSEALDVELPTEEDYDTLGGLIFDQFTTIPQDGSHPEVDAAGLHIRVEVLSDHRVESALVSKQAVEKENEEKKEE